MRYLNILVIKIQIGFMSGSAFLLKNALFV